DIIPELSFADLKHGHLSGANLNRANLSRANLDHATLHNATLNRADLLNANLSGADLFSADLSNTNLSGADLTGARLSRAKLFGANLTRAILTDTNFDQAKIRDTTFANVDLRRARNLEGVRSLGPSTIGVDTVYQSRGKIPHEFLKGCGVDDKFIVYIRSLVGSTIEFYSCFISYSHADKLFARRLHDALQGRGIRCWLDEHQIRPGDDMYDEVDRGIRLWDKVLLCASKSSLTSVWVDNEIASALQKEEVLWKARGRKILKLIPLNLDGYILSGQWQSGKAPIITRRLAADFTGWEGDNNKFEEEFERIVRALRSDDGGRETPPESKL
ncbi:MAG TPA: toll/interleukin-1 receptor domain-containing protein, partial [Blastocatellia bacterium]